MSELYKPELTYFLAVIKERNGEHDYSNDIIIPAADDTEALIKAENLARGWYEGCDYTQTEDWIEFDIGVSVKVDYVKQITPVEYFERNIMEGEI